MGQQYNTCHELFNALASGLESTGSLLKAEAAALQEAIADTRKELRAAIDIIMPELNPDLLACFDVIANETGANRDFTLMVKNMEDEDRAALAEMKAREQGKTTSLSPRQALDQARAELEILKNNADAFLDPLYKLKESLIDVDAHNFMYRNKLDENTAASFREHSKVKYTFSLAYRSGYDIVDHYRPLYGSIENDIVKLREIKTSFEQAKALCDAQYAVVRQLAEQVGEAPAQDDIATLEAKRYSPEDILNTVRGTLANLCEENPDFARVLSEEAGDHGQQLAAILDRIEDMETAAEVVDIHQNYMVERLEGIESLRLGFSGMAKPVKELSDIVGPINDEMALAREAIEKAAQSRNAAPQPE